MSNEIPNLNEKNEMNCLRDLCLDFNIHLAFGFIFFFRVFGIDLFAVRRSSLTDKGMILKSFKFSCCNMGLPFVSYPAKSFIGQTGI